MKLYRLLFLLGCVFWGALEVLAAPWGVMSNYVNEDAPNKTGERYLLRKILAGQTLSVGLQRDEYTDKHYDKLSRLIAQSYNDWFANAAQYIEKSGREAEFADILPLLRSGIQLQINDYGKDINFVFMPFKQIQWKCGRASAGCYTLNEVTPHIYLPSNTGLINVLSLGQENKKRISTHEVGHSLGFSDQYFQARSVNSDDIYGSTEERRTIMQHARKLTCDDADGMINLIDITLGNRRGGNHGWKTLCSKSQEYYIGGTSAGKGPYRLALNKHNAVTLSTYKKGRRVASEAYPFALPQTEVKWQETPAQTIIQKDKFGRPVKALGPNGETIYYAYLYDRTERLSLKDGRALNFVTLVKYPSKQRSGSLKSYKDMVFGQKGTLCMLKTRVITKQGYTSEYAEGIEKPELTLYIKRGYNRQGRLLTSQYSNPTAPKMKQAPALQSAAGIAAMGQHLSQKMGRQVEATRQNRLENQVDQWTQRTLEEFSRKTK